MKAPDFEDDDKWHKKEKIPRSGDPIVQKHLADRQALIEKEKLQRSGLFPTS
jgi:hypothetical protein